MRVGTRTYIVIKKKLNLAKASLNTKVVLIFQVSASFHALYSPVHVAKTLYNNGPLSNNGGVYGNYTLFSHLKEPHNDLLKQLRKSDSEN